MLYTNGANQCGPDIVLYGDGEFHISDGVCFAGVESINPITGKPTGFPLIVACVKFDAETKVLTINPVLMTSGQYRNASQLPANHALVYHHMWRRDE